MSKPKRTTRQIKDPDEIFEQEIERYEQKIEARIDSIAEGNRNEYEAKAEAGCTAARASAHRAPVAAGVQLSNTPPSSSKLDGMDSWVGAEDWLEYCLYIQWSNWRKLRERLEKAKEYAGMENAPAELFQIPFFGGHATVAPSGAREGKAGFAYRLFLDELIVLIADREEPHKTFPSVMVRITGTACLDSGAHECYKDAERMIKALKGTIIRNTLSRVDICLDMPEVSVEEFYKPSVEKRFVCQARKVRAITPIEGEDGITLYFGKPPLQCRIYDKLAEIEGGSNPHTKLCMSFYRWGGVIPEAATRVEFELRRKAIKERGIDSVEDYFAKRADLIHYLTTKWLRFTANKVDRKNKNQSKAQTLPLWNQVRKAFKNWAGEPPGLSLAPLPKEQADVRNLIKQLLGVGQTAAGYNGKEIETVGELLAYIEASTSKYGIKPKKRN